MSKVLIIGTIHQSTKKYTAMDLYNVLVQYNPDVIYEELPPEMHVDPSEKNIPFGEELESQESCAITWYCRKYKIPVIPVDLPKRNELFIQTISSDGLKKVYTILASLLEGGALSINFHARLYEYFHTLKEQQRLCGDSDIGEINGPLMDSLVLSKHQLVHSVCIPILSSYSKEVGLDNYLKNYEQWFTNRELYMAKAIRDSYSQYTRPVFPVGIEHRPGLSDKLSDISTLL
jgi:hypothetical protein